jgi:hypothetical protein
LQIPSKPSKPATARHSTLFTKKIECRALMDK